MSRQKKPSALVAGWLWSGSKVAKEMMRWSKRFDEDGTVGREYVRKRQSVFWWQTGPEGGVMGHGVVLGAATRSGGKGWYAREFRFPVEITKRMLDTPVPKREVQKTVGLRRVFREATRHRPNVLDLTRAEVSALRQLCSKAERKNPADAKSANAEVKRDPTGAGFGTPAANKRVERAAVKAVTADLSRRGFNVESVESQNLGYDLLCAAKGKMWHLEVKGIAGSRPSFVITANEIRAAESDPFFRIAIVTEALRKPHIRLLTGAKFLALYRLNALSFTASPLH